MRYILFSALAESCSGLCKFGQDHRALAKIAKDRRGCSWLAYQVPMWGDG
ncbi:MAG: hypothetical protein ACYC9Q_02805 [Bacillota bacterium]